jgi:hypothetical protein
MTITKQVSGESLSVAYASCQEVELVACHPSHTSCSSMIEGVDVPLLSVSQLVLVKHNEMNNCDISLPPTKVPASNRVLATTRY